MPSGVGLSRRSKFCKSRPKRSNQGLSPRVATMMILSGVALAMRQTVDITLVPDRQCGPQRFVDGSLESHTDDQRGTRATAKRIISEAEIPDITGGALDSREREPGPLYPARGSQGRRVPQYHDHARGWSMTRATAAATIRSGSTRRRRCSCAATIRTR